MCIILLWGVYYPSLIFNIQDLFFKYIPCLQDVILLEITQFIMYNLDLLPCTVSCLISLSVKSSSVGMKEEEQPRGCVTRAQRSQPRLSSHHSLGLRT